MLNKDESIEIAAVGNGYIVRAGGPWFERDRDTRSWTLAREDCMVFRTLAELSAFLAGHFTYRAKVTENDAEQTIKMAA